MTPQQIDAMKLALEALELCNGAETVEGVVIYTDKEITALEEALAEHAMQEVQRLGQEIEQAPKDWKTPLKEDAPLVKWAKEQTAPQQEPVAWMDADGNVSDNNDHKCFPIPLYTHPPQRTWVDLPDEEIKMLWIQYRAALPRYLCFAKALLARAKEENT